MAISAALRSQLAAIVGEENLLGDELSRVLYEYDGGVDRALPDVVVFPHSREQVVAIVRAARATGVPIVARGAGTGLSGGAVAREGGIIVSLNRMRRILEVDVENARAVVEPGVVNLEFSQSIAATGFYFAPDPSSQRACTLGGNVAENSGGPHTLLHGVTVNHITGLELVLADGSVAAIGGKELDAPGWDLTGLMTGSEGTLALVTAITLKLTRLPEAVGTLLAVYDRVGDAAATVTALTASGITPAACEMMDGFSLRAVEAYVHAGYPLDAAAVLLLEVEGLREEVDEDAAHIEALCRAAGARSVRHAADAHERELLWSGRKNAFGAAGRIAPNNYVMDGVIPRTRIAEVLEQIEAIGQRHGFRTGNIFHAGDGNLHPLVFFDERAGELPRALACSRDILRACVAVGGSITGEHGVGIEKQDLMPWIFSPEDLAFMARVRAAFNPGGLLNPNKLLPSAHMCAEIRADAPLYREQPL
ncbi:MAG: FAD-binding oxidoreductase [Terriglobales bacterium]